MIIKHVSEIFKIIMYDAALKTRLGKSLFCLVWMLVTVKKTATAVGKKAMLLLFLSVSESYLVFANHHLNLIK